MITCPLFYLLNTLRVVTILSLACCAAGLFACVVIGLRGNRLSFFVTANILVLWVMSLFLIVVEFELFRSYWRRIWPCFGPQASLITPGICQLAIAFQIFGALSGPMSKSIIGERFSAFNLAAAIIATVTGSANILADIRKKGLYLARMGFDLSRNNSRPENLKFQRMVSLNDLERQQSLERYPQGHEEESRSTEQVYDRQVEVEPSTYSIPTYYRTTTDPHIRQPEPAKLEAQSKEWSGMLGIPLRSCVRG
ncbi:hypothetical protein TWF703_004444 [Orbilia oligospora]|uniref:DUF7598 domain-containing protein n=1 Tax=Orbilia oligospora TaxID=2813651 RepID=A0A7C8JIC3_ORBOL|nr:hypothetical protein TWF703_004444 [Orbilia oligospora]